jgi:hypothetical protein
VLLDYPLLHVRGEGRPTREFDPQRGARHWRELDGVVGVPGHAVFPRGFDRCPVVAVLIEDANLSGLKTRPT